MGGIRASKMADYAISLDRHKIQPALDIQDFRARESLELPAIYHSLYAAIREYPVVIFMRTKPTPTSKEDGTVRLAMQTSAWYARSKMWLPCLQETNDRSTTSLPDIDVCTHSRPII